MKKWGLLLAACVLMAGTSAAQQSRLVTGKVYSFWLNGVRHYSSTPPRIAGLEYRTINYSYVETKLGDPTGRPLYKCTNSGTPFYTQTPAPGCVVIGIYRPTQVTNTPYAPVFHDSPCTQNCSGHEAGYEWAERHGIDDPDDCGGKSMSFIEGCQAYAEEQQARMIEDGECTDDDGDDRCD